MNRLHAVLLTAITTFTLPACGGGSSPAAVSPPPPPVDIRLAVPGGPYEGVVGEPVQFDGSGSSDSEGHALTYEWSFGDGGTSTLVMPTHIYTDVGTYDVSLQVCDGTGCSVNLDNNTSAVITAVPIASPGGVWRGIDSNLLDIVVLVTETGRFHFLDESESQGSGNLIVSNVDNISANYQYVKPIGFVYPDGTTSADCTLTGTVTERQNMTVATDCTTTAGTQVEATASLNYLAYYDQDSSLAIIAGNYSTPTGSVMSIAADGIIFVQDAVTGCIVNGQVSIIDTAFTAYDIQYGISNCIGQDAFWNGSSFTGLAVLDNSSPSSADFLPFALTGDVQGSLVSLFLRNFRL